jgi:hypothetical protein
VRSDDVDSAIEQSHLAMSEIVKGNPEPCKALFSHREDVTPGQPVRPVRPRLATGCRDIYRRGCPLPRGRGRRLRTNREAYHGRAGLHRGSGALPGQGRWQRRPLLDQSPRHERLPSRGRHLETRASPRRPNHHASAAGIRNPEVDRPRQICRYALMVAVQTSRQNDVLTRGQAAHSGTSSRRVAAVPSILTGSAGASLLRRRGLGNGWGGPDESECLDCTSTHQSVLYR